MPQVPKYISAEANVDELSNCRLMLEALTSAGYGRFKVLNQAMNRKVRLPKPALEGNYVQHVFAGHASGPFGEETPGYWSSADNAYRRCIQVGKLRRKFHAQGGFGRNLMQRYYNKYRYLVHRDAVGWYDIHAAI
jgi:hypothetical protein